MATDIESAEVIATRNRRSRSRRIPLNGSREAAIAEEVAHALAASG
jgi:hypothetical protein